MKLKFNLFLFMFFLFRKKGVGPITEYYTGTSLGAVNFEFNGDN